MHRFTLGNLFALTLAIAVVLASLAQETVDVACAALFCFASCVGISYLFFLSCGNLFETASEAYRQKRLSILSRRYRWTLVDGTIVVWGLITISIANFVHESSFANAWYFVILGWFAGPLLAAAILIWCRPVPDKHKSSACEKEL